MGRDLDAKIEVRHGDTPTSARSRQAKSPPDMLITTPETLQSILVGKRMKEHLRAVRWVVVDEVHELATDERGVQLSIALERLLELTGREFQRIGLSATIGEPERIGQFLVGTGRQVNILRSDEERGLQISIGSVSPTGKDHEEAETGSSYFHRRSCSEDTRADRGSQVNASVHEHQRTCGGVSVSTIGFGLGWCKGPSWLSVPRVARRSGKRVSGRLAKSAHLH